MDTRTDASRAVLPPRRFCRPGPGAYLIHFTQPLGHAQHYLGWARDVPRRLQEHQGGAHAARLMQVVAERGIAWEVVRVWQPATRHDERRLKNRGGHARICPTCRPNLQTPAEGAIEL